MAKFNTLSGGYYGKLGATVGQRWKNLRTVRTYVIPTNPQTPKQQSNRNRFADCVWYAQIAQQINPKVTAFDTTSKTLWNCRMSTARALQDLEYTQMDRIPLYPTTLSLPNTISAASITSVVDSNHVEVTVEGVTLEEERVLVMLVLLPGAEDWKDRLALCIGSNGDEGGNVFTFRIPEGVTLSSGMYCRFCSCDDVSSATDLIASAQIELPLGSIDVHTFDTSVTSVERSGNQYTFVLSEPFNNGTNTVSDVSIYGVINGSFASANLANASLINRNGYFALVAESEATDNQDLPAFPSGSKLRISSISSISSTVQATATNTEDSIVSTDLSRNYNNTISSVSRSGNDYTFTFSRNLPSVASTSGTLSIHSVVRGAFADQTLTGISFEANTISWTSGATVEEDLPAFATGSTITPNLTISSNGVSYTPQTATAQALTSDDLTRTITSDPTFTQDDTTGYLSWSFNAVLPALNRNIAVEMRASPFLYFETSNVSDTGIFNDGANLCYALKEGYDYVTYLVGCYIKPSAVQGFVLNGVTYNLGVREYNFDSAAYETDVPLSDAIVVNGNVWTFRPNGAESYSVDGISNARLSDLPQNWTIQDEDSNEYTFTIASENEVLLDNTDAYFSVNVTNGGNVMNLNTPLTADDYEIGLLFTQGEKNFTTQIRVFAQSTFEI